MLAPVSSSPDYTDLGRPASAASAQRSGPHTSPPGSTPTPPPSGSSANKAAQAPPSPITRARLSGPLLLSTKGDALSVDRTLSAQDGGAASGTGSMVAEYKIPTRLTLEIQKAREAIAEAGGGLRAMQDYMRQISGAPVPTFSISV